MSVLPEHFRFSSLSLELHFFSLDHIVIFLTNLSIAVMGTKDKTSTDYLSFCPLADSVRLLLLGALVFGHSPKYWPFQ